MSLHITFVFPQAEQKNIGAGGLGLSMSLGGSLAASTRIRGMSESVRQRGGRPAHEDVIVEDGADSGSGDHTTDRL